jgi:adenosylcobinamide kinase/adenosylcobinamide-phosphate guanylyltransferase
VFGDREGLTVLPDGSSPRSWIPLRLSGRLVVVIGGGSAVALHVGWLLAGGAQVRVVAPELSDVLSDSAERGLIAVRKRDFRAEDIDGAWLVLTCAERDSMNARAAADAQQRRIWCVSGDDLAPGDVQSPLTRRPLGAVVAQDAGETALRPGRRVLVLGGARSGKSAAAESMLADAGPVDYVATGQLAGTGDAEWDQRVREHQARRPQGWRTLETLDVAGVLDCPDSAAPMLVDCLATWLARIMDDCGLWSDNPDADSELAERMDHLVAAWQQTKRHAVAVSNEVGCGIVPATASGRRFRDELGWLNTRIAATCEEVWICTAGIPLRLR